uniref:Lipid-A-disaccharide synthase n=1 Tax=Leptospirillum ferrodiazotrophum TaxID=412449 RepID=C6I0H5_9BACT|nr:MAG: lipid-A-disaccharide synthase [Leptospirillum ferrodiazotrophum]
MTPSLLLVAGEASGDHHGALLLSEMKRICPDLVCHAAGGPALAEAGAKIVVPMDRLNVMGFFEVASRLPGVIASYRSLLATVDREKIRTAVLIDFPDFNLLLARALKSRGVRIHYYVSPQLWAWRKGRVRTIRRLVDHMFVIFPFEEPFYREHGVPVTYAGHPLLDEPFPEPQEKQALREEFLGEAPKAPLVALAPGSRPGEIRRLYPRMLAALALLEKRIPGIRALVPVPPSVSDEVYRAIEKTVPHPPVIRISGRFREVMAAADCALVTSGTATLETGLVGTPLVVVYVMNQGSYRLARWLVDVPAIGMVNLVAGRMVAPELIQEAATPQAMADHLWSILSDPSERTRILADLERLRQVLGGPGASARIARAILERSGLCNPPSVPGSPKAPWSTTPP